MMKRISFLTGMAILAVLSFHSPVARAQAGCDLILTHTSDDSVVVRAEFFTPVGVTFRIQAIYLALAYDPGTFHVDSLSIMNHRFAASGFQADSDPKLDTDKVNPDICMYGESVTNLSQSIQFPENTRRSLCTFRFFPNAPGPGTTSFMFYGNVVAPAYSGYWITTSIDNQPFSPATDLINVDWPVEFVSFQAAQQGRTIALRWVTASETNNYGFHVQRRAMGTEDWTTLDFVQGRGTSREDIQYMFIDKSLTADGQYEYRLRQQDFDGGVTFSHVASVLYRTSTSSFSLEQNYPNPLPTGGSTVLRYSLLERSKIRLVVTNALGQEVSEIINYTQNSGTWSSTWSASGLPSGTYFATLTATSEETRTTSRATIPMAIAK